MFLYFLESICLASRRDLLVGRFQLISYVDGQLLVSMSI